MQNRKNLIEQKVRELCELALTGPIKVEYFSGSKIAGWALPTRGIVRFNEEAIEKYFYDMLHNTVAHEVAHVVDYRRNGLIKKNGKIIMHGETWKSIMEEVFHTAPTGGRSWSSFITHNYELVGAGRTYKKFLYTCNCQSWEFTAIRHNRIARGVVYKCPKCNSVINEVEE